MKMFEALNLLSLYGSIKDEKISIKLAYKLNKLMEWADKEKDWYQKENQKLIDEYSEKDENGELIYQDETKQTIKIKEDCAAEANQKITDLINLEVVAPEGLVFKLEDFDNLNLTIDELRPLIPLIEE